MDGAQLPHLIVTTIVSKSLKHYSGFESKRARPVPSAHFFQKMRNKF